MTEYFNPNKYPFQQNNLGTILNKKNGQVGEVVQVSGVNAGEPVFHPPKSLIDFDGIFAAIAAANRPKIALNSVMSLTAANAGTLIFDAEMALHLMQSFFGIAMVNENRIPPPTKTGWYDQSNPTATQFGALNLTWYEKGQAVSIARDDVVAVQLEDGSTAYPGDLIMAAIAETGDFGQVATLLTRADELITAVSNGLTLANPYCVEIESVHVEATGVNEWDSGSSLTPDIAANEQVSDLITAAADCGIHYKYWSLGALIPIGMMYKCVLGKTVFSKAVAGEIIGMEVW